MNRNVWKIGTILAFGILMATSGFFIAHYFGSNANHGTQSSVADLPNNMQPTRVESGVTTNSTPITAANPYARPQNHQVQQQEILATPKQSELNPALRSVPPPVAEPPRPLITVEELKSSVLNESESVVTSLLGYSNLRRTYSVKGFGDTDNNKYDATSLTYVNIAWDPTEKVSKNCAIYFEYKMTEWLTVDRNSRLEARRVSCW